ncbi:hypothetical protein EV361DRAFT_865743 [Lentinula raphanica]|nr:hypothetical protein F5880DRAFT_1616916 [Lentinula raphanica]KAJ3974972.1 hypothetical protein EV361DRAFT_865743 [Lentinula raphanica]
MFCFRTIHLVFGLILIGAVKAVPMPPSGTTSKSPKPLANSGENPLDYFNYLVITKREDPRYVGFTDHDIQSEISSMQKGVYRVSGWIQVTIYFDTRTDSPKPTMKNKLSKLWEKLLKWFKGSPAPSPNAIRNLMEGSPAPTRPNAARNLMLKEEAGVSEERESMLRESIQRWSGREVPWDKALEVQVIYDGGLEPGKNCFHYYVSWVYQRVHPEKVDSIYGSIGNVGNVVFMQLYRELPKGWSNIDIDD